MTYQYESIQRDDQNKTIYIIDMKREPDTTMAAMTRGLLQKHSPDKACAILVSKTNYHNIRLCTTCGAIPRCDRCDISLSYQQLTETDAVGICSLCHTVYDVEPACPECASETMIFWGMGMEQVGSLLKDWGADPIYVSATTSNSRAKIRALADQYTRHDHPCLVGTTALIPLPCAMHSVVVMDTDMFFRHGDVGSMQSGYYTLRALLSGSFRYCVLQTMVPDHPVLRMLVRRDHQGFLSYIDTMKRSSQIAPYGEECLLAYRHHDQASLLHSVDTVMQQLRFWQNKLAVSCDIYRTPPRITKALGKYRYHIIIKGSAIKAFLDHIVRETTILRQGRTITRNPHNIR